MKESNYWQQFFTTGKVEDYLKYRADVKEDKDEADDAGERGSDRDRAQGRADWRI